MKYCTLRRLWAHLHETAEIERRKAEVEAFNKVITRFMYTSVVASASMKALPVHPL